MSEIFSTCFDITCEISHQIEKLNFQLSSFVFSCFYFEIESVWKCARLKTDRKYYLDWKISTIQSKTRKVSYLFFSSFHPKYFDWLDYLITWFEGEGHKYDHIKVSPNFILKVNERIIHKIDNFVKLVNFTC